MMQTLAPFQLPLISKTQRNRMLRYAKKVLSAQQQMITQEGKNLLHYTLQEADQHFHMIHYPKGDRIDHTTGAQYFYHCHRENYEQLEHGHFHCFIRYPHIPKRIKPAPIPDWDKYLDNPMTHLVAISINLYGQPIRLFTVNRWVSSEIWYDSKHVNANLNRFKMTLTQDPYWQVLDQWVEGILHLFSPQIQWLHQARDVHIHHLTKDKDQNETVYEDKNIEELSEISIDLKTQIQWLLETSA